jgi:uncharacterized RDD family membrane protein YckC
MARSLLRSANAAAPEVAKVTVEARIGSEDKPKVGDQVPVVVTVRSPKGTRINFPNKPFVGKNARLAGNTVAVEDEGGEAVERHTLTVVPVRSGKVKIPAIEVPFVDAAGNASSASSEPLRLVVGSRLANEVDPELEPARDPRPFEQWNWWLIWGLTAAGIALVAAAVTLVAVRIYAKRFANLAPPAPPRPAHEVAYERLFALRAADLPAQGRFKEFYLDLTEIIREYFGNRYGIQALGETSTELLDALQRIRPVGLGMEEVRVFLGDADLVKFAKRTPELAEMETALVQAQLFVDRTREEARERQEPKPAPTERVVAAAPAKRIFAFLIDLVLYSIVSTILLVAMKQTGKSWFLWLDLGLLLLFVLLRDLPSIGSPGKALAGLKVARGSEPSLPVGAGDRVLRNVPHAVLLAGQVAETLWMAYDPERRRIGDRWSDTQVIDQRPEQGEATAMAGAFACALTLAFMLYVLPVHVLHLLA